MKELTSIPPEINEKPIKNAVCNIHVVLSLSIFIFSSMLQCFFCFVNLC